MNATVAVGGLFAPLVRFEPLCRQPACFETQFGISVLQNGTAKFSAVFGALGSLSLLDADGTLIDHAATWAGLHDRVYLEPGPVTVRLSVSAELTPPNSGRRNIDVVVLTSNFTDLAVRLANPPDDNTPLDGMLTQRGDVFLRVVNHADGVPMNLSVPFGAEHSSYWTHKRFPGPSGGNQIPTLLLAASPGGSSGWKEAGSRLDTLDDGEWGLQAAAANASLLHQLHYTLEVGVPAADGSIERIGAFEEHGCPIPTALSCPIGPAPFAAGSFCTLILAYDANTRGTKRIRRVEAQVETAAARVAAYAPMLPKHGKPPSANGTIISCTNCFPNMTGLRPAWNVSATQFRAAYNLHVQGEDNLASKDFAGCDRAWAYRTIGDPCRSPSCWDGIKANATRCLQARLESEFSDPMVGRCVAIASLGDEITIPTPESTIGGPEQATALFIPWCKARGLAPKDIDCNLASLPNVTSNWTGCHYNGSDAIKASTPRLYYWSKVWGFEWAALQMREFTQITKKYLPNAGVGANFESGDYIHYTPYTVELSGDVCSDVCSQVTTFLSHGNGSMYFDIQASACHGRRDTSGLGKAG